MQIIKDAVRDIAKVTVEKEVTAFIEEHRKELIGGAVKSAFSEIIGKIPKIR